MVTEDAIRLAEFLGERIGATGAIVARYDTQTPTRYSLSPTAAIEIDLADPTTWAVPIDLARCPAVIGLGPFQRTDDAGRLPEILETIARTAPFTIITTTLDDESPAMRGGTGTAVVGTPDRLVHMLTSAGIDSRFVGASSDRAGGRTVVAIADQCRLDAARAVPDGFCPLALMAVYNEADIVPQTVTRLLDDGFEVRVLDNWSTDGTFEALCAMARHGARLTVERFPSTGPSDHYDYLGILDWKERVAADHPGRWIASVDADEIRASPWPGVSFRAGLHVCDVMEFNAVDFTVLNFHATDERFEAGLDPEQTLRHFEFGQLHAYFVQVKVWKQGSERVTLCDSGGHEAAFAGRRVFPYKFLLKHYPLRNSGQAHRKIFTDRLPRYSRETRARGWHVHYDHCRTDDRLLGDASRLLAFDDQRTRSEHLIALLSGIGLARR